jgi:outer membrane protein assembly factor BamB
MRGSSAARTAAVAALALGASGCWGQPGYGPLHQGFNPVEDQITAADVATLDEAWTATVDDGEVRSDPVVSGPGLLHVADDEAVYGFDPATGARRWRSQVVPTNGPAGLLPTQVTAEGDSLHVGWGGVPDWGVREEYDARTGRGIDTNGGLGVGAITARDPWVVATFSGFVEGTVAGSGITVDGPTSWMLLFGFGVQPKLPLPTGPAVASDRLFVGAESSYFGDDILAGWDLSPGCPAGGNPTSCQPDVKTQLDGAPTGPVVADGEQTAYVGTSAGTVYAVDADTGAVRWRSSLGSPIVEQPALTPSTLYVVTSVGDLVTLPAGGCGSAVCSPTATVDLAGAPAGPPAVAGGVVYVASAGGVLEAFSASSPGAVLFTDNLASDITGGPTIASGRVYVGTAGGEVVAYTPAD